MCIFIQAAYHELVVRAYGPNLEWHGSAPNDPIVVERGGILMAVVMPYFETTDNDREPYFRKAAKERAAIRAQKRPLNTEQQALLPLVAT
jgi:hypothetical protein